MKNSLLNFGLICAIIVQGNCGILDWFRGKHAPWISKIDKVPLVEAYYPRGLRVSIGDVEGLQVFGFHGKLNQCFGRNENGSFFGYITEPKNGRWYYINEYIELKVGDALHFWIYAKLNGQEHSFSKEVRIIHNLIPKPQDLQTNLLPAPKVVRVEDNQLDKSSDPAMCPCDQLNVLNNFASTSSMFPAAAAAPAPPTTPDNLICKSQVDSLTEVLLDLLKNQELDSNLLLTGKERDADKPALDEVTKILTGMELYDLVAKIKFAYYTDCGIYFEMSSLIDKKRILVRAEIDLKNSKYQFVDGDSTKCLNTERPDPDNSPNYDLRVST